jgi:hypothetical protein
MNTSLVACVVQEAYALADCVKARFDMEPGLVPGEARPHWTAWIDSLPQPNRAVTFAEVEAVANKHGVDFGTFT